MAENQYDHYLEHGDTPLTRASRHGDLQKVIELLEAGANVNFRENPHMTNYSALHQACLGERFEIVKVLLAAGAEIDPYCAYSGGGTPLHSACKGNNVEIVQYLLDHGANINAKDLQSRTPLAHARIYKNAAIIKILLERGAE